MSQPNMLVNMFYDVSKWVLWGEGQNEDGKRPRLVLSFRDGNPRFTVYTGGQGAAGMISFPMDIPHLAGVMTALQDIANGPKEQQYKLESLSTVYEDNKPTSQKKTVSTLVIGKSKDGVVYMCVVAESKPKVIFPFKASQWHTWRTSNNEAVQEETVSKFIAIGMAKSVLSVLGNIMVAYSDEEYRSGTRKQVSTNRDGNTSGVQGGKKPEPAFVDLDDIL